MARLPFPHNGCNEKQRKTHLIHHEWITDLIFIIANKTYVALQFKLLQKLLIHTGYKQLSPFRNKEELSFLLNREKKNQ